MTKRKQTYILNYRVIVKPDSYTGSNRRCFTAYCPTLGVADNGDTVEEALQNVKGAIECTLDYLMETGKDLPVDNTEEEMIVHTKIKVNGRSNLIFA